LSRVSKLGIDTWGSDIDPIKQIQHSRYVSGNIECLPFTDKEFDVVTCHHTLEHIINIDKAISELKRIAKKRIIIVIPCQRYYYYTLDEHLHFFPHKELLIQKMGMGKFICKKIFGDWVYIGNID
jgi:ubiquinone/menaquinone biosynthesis C-methylase UbiE